MVDKIDRPEAPPPYFITRAKDAKESQHQQSQQREEQEKRRQKELLEKNWSKFDRRERVIRAIRTTRDQIDRCLFRGVFLHSGVGTLQIDVHWKDGRRTEGALVLLGRLEDYLRLKRFRLGQEVPDRFWSRGTAVELGVIQLISSGTTFPSPAAPSGAKAAAPPPPPAPSRILSALGLLEAGSRRFNWGVLVLYAAGIAITILVLTVALR